MLVILPDIPPDVNRKPSKSGNNPRSGRTCRYATQAADRDHRSAHLRHRERGPTTRARTIENVLYELDVVSG